MAAAEAAQTMAAPVLAGASVQARLPLMAPPSKDQLEQIIAQAREESEATRRESDEYVIETLTRLQDELQKTLGQVSNGILALQQHRKKGND